MLMKCPSLYNDGQKSAQKCPSLYSDGQKQLVKCPSLYSDGQKSAQECPSLYNDGQKQQNPNHFFPKQRHFFIFASQTLKKITSSFSLPSTQGTTVRLGIDASVADREVAEEDREVTDEVKVFLSDRV